MCVYTWYHMTYTCMYYILLYSLGIVVVAFIFHGIPYVLHVVKIILKKRIRFCFSVRKSVKSRTCIHFINSYVIVWRAFSCVDKSYGYDLLVKPCRNISSFESKPDKITRDVQQWRTDSYKLFFFPYYPLVLYPSFPNSFFAFVIRIIFLVIRADDRLLLSQINNHYCSVTYDMLTDFMGEI